MERGDLGIRIRRSVGSLDRRPIVHTHLLHHAAEEAFPLWGGPGLEDFLEVGHERGDQLAVECLNVEPLALGLHAGR